MLIIVPPATLVRQFYSFIIDKAMDLVANKAMTVDGQTIAKSAFKRLFVDDCEITAAGADCAFFEMSGERAAPPILERISAALAVGDPLSLVRVGNGEGNAIALIEGRPSPTLFDGFDFEFGSQNGCSIAPDLAVPFSRLVFDAIIAADIQGYRIGRFDERAVACECLVSGKTSPALGITYARSLFARQVRSGNSGSKWFTNAWIHFDLMQRFDELIANAAKVVIISGRGELAPRFKDRLGSRLAWFASVPVQGFAPPSLAASHYAMFPSVRDRLRRADLRGTLVLVGAGLFGKVYCNDARKAGGVAIDMGSAFDLMAGFATRPVHKQFDLSSINW
ncbi:hypothetical protein QE385_004020 [Sphingomonas sp. SORGH_AS 950]|uniref:GT-D fold domain-containing protein n=1 Tax=Sphingomonas sp. SORGH_AS_0950 TaxID=3041792 RepID=UPI00278AB2D4|nr:hypothetical protein [Sphingomonas sp. SORGH_AS_0950]MDQ1159623.1 hypothetical protein [Sphingomonas sp. SORGH_AS_0950]